jgi:hypothetical protein
MQFTHLAKQSPNFKPANIGNSPIVGISKHNLGAHAHMPVTSKIVTLPAKGMATNNPASGGINNGNTGKVTTLPGKLNPTGNNNGNGGKVTTLPGKINTNSANAGNNGGNTGKVTTFPGRITNNPVRVTNKPMVMTRPMVTRRPMMTTAPRHFSGGMGGGGFSQRFASSPSRGSFGGGSFGGGFRR